MLLTWNIPISCQQWKRAGVGWVPVLPMSEVGQCLEGCGCWKGTSICSTCSAKIKLSGNLWCIEHVAAADGSETKRNREKNLMMVAKMMVMKVVLYRQKNIVRLYSFKYICLQPTVTH